MIRIKKGDKVQLLAGKDKGKIGEILRVLVSKNRAIVDGVNLVKKHMRKRSEQDQGGIKETPASVNISNLNIFCSNCNRGVRVKSKALKDKSKIRVCTKCNKPI